MSSVANGSSRAGRLPAWLLLFGVASIGLLVGSDVLRQRTIVGDTAWLRAVGEIQRDAAISHLWLEEYVSGDEVPIAEISEALERSLTVVGVLLGERPPAGDLGPLAEDDLRRHASAVARRLERFLALSRERRRGFEAGLPVGIGSAIDVEYDAVFADLQGAARDLQAALEERMTRRRERSRLVLASVVVAWGALIFAAVVALWSRERQRRRAAEALAASRHQVLQSQKLEAVGRIAGGLAHDVNNYLAAIRGHCELVLMKSEPGGRVAKKMDAAIRTVLKASSLIDRLLAFGHPQPARLEALRLDEVIDGIETMLRPSLGEAVRVRRRRARDPWYVEADPAQLEQVVVNLVVNARDAMPEGGEIVIETANVRRPDAAGRETEQVMLAVGDEGQGIPPEVRDQIFEPFWTTKGKAGHSGLGLATVYAIVQQSGGAIEVESEVGRGTVVRVYLPRTTRRPEARSAAESGEAARGHGERILLVDDNEELRESTGALLETLGYRVTTAASGEEALEVFGHDGDDVALVLTDVVMPGLSGRELADRLRERRAVPVVFMSGYTEDVVLRHGVERGEAVFTKKQFSAAELARTIRAELDRTRRGNSET